MIDKRLSSNLGMLYGPHLTCRLSIAQGHLLITLADTIPVLPKFEDIRYISGTIWASRLLVGMDSLVMNCGISNTTCIAFGHEHCNAWYTTDCHKFILTRGLLAYIVSLLLIMDTVMLGIPQIATKPSLQEACWPI